MCVCACYVVRVCARACMRLVQYNIKYVYALQEELRDRAVLLGEGEYSYSNLRYSSKHSSSMVLENSISDIVYQYVNLFVCVCLRACARACLGAYLGTCVRVGIVLHIYATDMWSSSSAARPCRYIRLRILLFAPRATDRHTDIRVISISDKRGWSQRHTTTADVMTQMAHLFQKASLGCVFVDT